MPRTTPPPLPHEVFSRVLKLARVDGQVVLWLSAGFALLAAMNQDAVGAIAGCAAAGAAAIEIHGAGLLSQGESRGLDWLIRSQLLLLATILIYAAVRMANFDPATVEPYVVFTPEMDEQLKQANLTRHQFLRTVSQIAYSVVGIVALLYQGGMARYYARRREAVEQALQQATDWLA